MCLLKFGSAKFNSQIPIRSEDINEMQTEFSRSRMFLRSGMHTPVTILVLLQP